MLETQNREPYLTMTSLTYRAAIGIVVANARNQVLVGRRNDMENQWQFPQGGVDTHEVPRNAVFRELEEETGIGQECVEILCNTRDYLTYEYPPDVVQELNVKKTWRYAGQQVQFFLLRYHGTDEKIDVQNVSEPEFDAWKWVEYWEPMKLIVEFKRNLYRRALTELAPGLQFEVQK